MKGKKIKQITDASIISAIYGVIFLISRFSGGQLEYSFSFLLPLPIAMYGYKYSFKQSFIPFVATTILSFFLSVNPFNAFLIVMPLLFSGMLLGGLLIKKDVKPIYTILIIGIFISIVEVLSTVVFYDILGMENIFNDISNLMTKLEPLIIKMAGDFALIHALLEGFIPSIIIVISIMTSLTSYLLFVLLIKRIFKDELSKNAMSIFSLNNLIPKQFTIFYCLILLGTFLGLFYFKTSVGFLRILIIILINSSVIIGVIYLYFGLRVCSLFIGLINKKWMLIIEFLLIIVFPILFVLVGILDSFIELQRKIYKKYVNTIQK